MAEEKDKGGRPTNYGPHLIAIVNQLTEDGGANVAQICFACKIGSFSTFYAYKKDYPEFAEAVGHCNMASSATLEGALMDGATGKKKIDSKAAMWMLYNRDKEEYSMPGRPAAGDQNINVNIGNINMATLNKLSSAELDRMLKATEDSIKAITVTQMPELKSITVKEDPNES